MSSNSSLNPPLSVTLPLDAPTPMPPHGTVRWTWLLLVIYFISGMTGLAYEVLWARMLSLQFGVSIFGVVIAVAAFMAGLGGGSLLGTRWVRRSSLSPLLIFAALEGGVGLYALGIPWLQQTVDSALGGGGAQASLAAWYALQAGVALLLLFVPALALGASFPLMLKALESGAPSPRPPLARMYGLNALGGALGALLPLLLLPVLGWSKAIYVVAGISLCVAATAFLLSLRRYRHPPVPITASVDAPLPSPPALPVPVLSLLAYGGVGAAALMLQVGWTRLFGMILLRTEYVLAVLLAVFLVGIGVGSLVARPGKRVGVVTVWFAILPVLAGGMSVLGLACLPWLAEWVEQARFASLAGALWQQGLAVAVLTLPVTLVLGAWLPLLTARLGGHPAAAPWLYGINSLGAALGAMAAGFVLIPWLGTPATLCLAAALLFVCGMVWAPKALAVRASSWGVMALVAVLAWQGRLYELPPVRTLLPVAQAGSQDIYLHEDALSITHVVERPDGQRLLLADLQRMDASSDPTAVESQQNQARLPLLLHAAPRSVLFLGLGTGISAAGSLPFSPLARTGVELSQGAITAASDWFAPVNHNVMRRAGRPSAVGAGMRENRQQLRVVRDDARRFLRNDTAYYDVIIGDLFHPDLVGHSALLSVQQFQRARARLTGQGVFVQWLALNQFDAGSLDIILRSFRRVFPNAVVFMDGFRLALVGPRNALQGAPAMLANLNRLAPAEQMAATGGEGAWTWLGRYWGNIPQSTGPVQDEWAPQIEYRLPRARYTAATATAGARDTLNLGNLLATLLERRPSLPQAAAALNVPTAAMPDFERSYVASFLAVRSWVMALSGDDSGQPQRLMRLAYEANPRDRWIGFDLADNMLATLPQAIERGMDKRSALRTILQIRPDHAEVLRALWQLEKDAGNHQAAAEYQARLKVISPLGR